VFPVLNVSVFVLAPSAAHLLGGDVGSALRVGVLGAIFLVGVPGLAVMRLERRLGDPAGLSGPAYFVGFVDGGLTVGPAGAVLGPLAVTVLLALRGLLADDGFPDRAGP
jgi:hypothetical protein